MKLLGLIEEVKKGKTLKRTNWPEGRYLAYSPVTDKFFVNYEGAGSFPVVSMFFTCSSITLVTNTGFNFVIMDDTRNQLFG